MNVGAIYIKMGIKHVHTIYKRVCGLGVGKGSPTKLLEASNGDDFGRQIVAIAIYYVSSKTKSQTTSFALASIWRITRRNNTLNVADC